MLSIHSWLSQCITDLTDRQPIVLKRTPGLGSSLPSPHHNLLPRQNRTIITHKLPNRVLRCRFFDNFVHPFGGFLGTNHLEVGGQILLLGIDSESLEGGASHIGVDGACGFASRFSSSRDKLPSNNGMAENGSAGTYQDGSERQSDPSPSARLRASQPYNSRRFYSSHMQR